MSLHDRIKEARIKKGLTQEQLGELVGVAKTTITGYEKNREPTAAKVGEIADVLNVDVNFLYQDEVKERREDTVSLEELSIIKKYRTLDDFGKKHINYELNREAERVEEARQQKKYIESLRMETSSELVPSRIISYCQRLASAGSGEYLFDDIPTDVIKVKDTPESQKADFVIGVNGDSMEPDYFDGEKVFVEKSSDIEIGEAGVFVRGNECFIKECGRDGLISKNPKYSDVEPFSEGIKVVGKVIGKALEI